jgi:Pectinacetylesterase
VQRRTLTALAAALVLVMALVGACGGDSPDPEAGTEPQTRPVREEPDEVATPAGWKQVKPGGDCQCSDGSEFSFWVRDADPEKVVLLLDAGGACFSAETCDPERDLYTTAVEEGPSSGGVFDFADERNPFAGYSAVYVPYCTGDVHLGTRTTEYAPGLTVHHAGFANGTAALDHLTASFPGAREVVVLGESAGSVAAPIYGALVSDRLPDARVTVLADGSGSYPDDPAFNQVFDAWGTAGAVPPWTFPGLTVQAAAHDPDIVFARHDHARDDRQAVWDTILGLPASDLLARIDGNEAQIEAAGVTLHSYTAPGEEHVILTDGAFYTEDVDGELFVDWVTRLVAGEPVDDVYCTDC